MCFLRIRSIGQFRSRAHKMVFTAALQRDGFCETSSVTVKELEGPALDRSFPRGGLDEPACGGGVDAGSLAGGAEEDAGGATGLGGQLQPPGLDPRQPGDRRDYRAHPPAPQAFGDRPRLVGQARAQEIQPLQGHAVRRQSGRIKLAIGIAPDDRAALARRFGQQRRNEKRLAAGGVTEQFMHSRSGEGSPGGHSIESFQTGAETAAALAAEARRVESKQPAVVT